MPLERGASQEQRRKLDRLLPLLKGKRAEVTLGAGYEKTEGFEGTITEVVLESGNIFCTITRDDNPDHTLTFPIGERSHIQFDGVLNDAEEVTIDNLGHGEMRVELWEP